MFVNKPLVLVANKVDIKKIQDLPSEKKKFFDQFKSENIPIVEMSTLMEDGVMNVRNEVSDYYELIYFFFIYKCCMISN